MGNIESIVDSLENRISKVLHKLEALKQNNAKLKEEIEATQEKMIQQEAVIGSWEEKYESLKFANSILGSDESKRETKLKINTLIREIDHCISQLSE
ncbi:MAG: chromosome segregation ATPase [Glaciecola sp.]|jgi:chromosome segregation ATPase